MMKQTTLSDFETESTAELAARVAALEARLEELQAQRREEEPPEWAEALQNRVAENATRVEEACLDDSANQHPTHTDVRGYY